MRTKLPPNVLRERNRHGKIVYYYRVGKGPRIRLPIYGTPSFGAAYKAACMGITITPSNPSQSYEGSLKWGIAQYKEHSLHWRGLGEGTKKQRDHIFASMVEKSGHIQLKDIHEDDIVDAREERSKGKGHAANNFLKAVKPLFAYFRTKRWIDIDPARNVDAAATINGHREAWTIEHYKKYEERHPVGTLANLALRIFLFTGFRLSDAMRFGPQHIKDNFLTITPNKTVDSSGVDVHIPILAPLKEAIEATEGKGADTFLVSEKGKPFASNVTFCMWFASRCDEAGLAVRAHGLRKLGPTLAADAGASPHELMAMFGWVTLAQAELYTRTADRKRLAEVAANKLLSRFEEVNTPRTFLPSAGISEISVENQGETV